MYNKLVIDLEIDELEVMDGNLDKYRTMPRLAETTTIIQKSEKTKGNDGDDPEPRSGPG